MYKLFEEYSNKGASTFMASCFSNVSQPPSINRREREKLPTYDVSCFLINPLPKGESFIWSFDKILKNLIAEKLTILENINLIFI